MSTATAAPANALETVTLIQVNATCNNNKFYELSKMPDGNTFARWGRVGGTVQTRTYPGHYSFDVKREEKLRKGYTVFNGGRSFPAASGNYANRRPLQQRVSAGLFPTGAVGAAADLITSLIRSNRHAIDTATDGRITVSDSGNVTTALGPVSLSQVDQARRELSILRTGYNNRAVEKYLTLIPQKIVSVRRTEWVTRSWCREQDDLLDALESAITMSGSQDAGTDELPGLSFRHTLTELSKGDVEFARIARKFDRSRNSVHAANQLSLHRVWALEDENAASWDKRMAALKHSRELWHGTTTGNVLSILRTGLICPPTSAGAYNTTGRMFGDGVYFSDQSTKSLNYAIGSAPGQRGRSAASENPMMFLADVAMGRECRSDTLSTGNDLMKRSRTGADDKGRKFDSLYIRGGHCGVMNNEMIVWRTEQIKLTHLCEFR